KTGLFPIYLTGPINRSFNYADAGDGATGGSQMYWFASKFNLPAAALYQKKVSRSGSALDLLWYPLDLVKQKIPEMPLAAYYRFAEVATMRSAWNDTNAWYVGFKAGDNKANHSHLDIGSFVLDALGKRWALDLGSDDYNMPGYFSTGANGPRWNYYRMRAEGHNVIVLNPGLKPDQDPLASAKIIRFSTKGNTSLAVADLTPAYAAEATKVMRGIALADGQTVVIQDEIKTEKPSHLYWFMHTRAKVIVARNGRKATMTIDSAQVEVEIISPAKAKFTVMAAAPLPSSPKSDVQNKNEGVNKLSIALSKVTDELIIVEIHPVNKKISVAKTFYKPLNEW
ncbi:MAG: heparinase II/III family protein, partial [Bacteroidales bacterium]